MSHLVRNIYLDDFSQYMESLLAHRKKGTGHTMKSKGRGRPAKGVLDLEHASGDEIDDDAGEDIQLMKREQERYGQLERKCKGQCEKCKGNDPDIWCKINKNGEHTGISFSMRNAWAHSLVR